MSKTITHEGVTYKVIGGTAKPGDLIYYCVDDGSEVGVSRVAESGYKIDDFYTEDETYVWVTYGDTYEVIGKAPDATDLIANLARRVSVLETHLAPKECEDTPDTPKAAQIRQACDTVRDLLIRKNHDYGDSFAQQYAKYGLQSALIRMDDKMRRLETLSDGTSAQVDESIEDTLADLAGYALLALVEARAARE